MSDCSIYSTPIVNKDFRGTRIDKFLAKCFPDISRSQIQRNIEEGNVTCDKYSSHKNDVSEVSSITQYDQGIVDIVNKIYDSKEKEILQN